MQEKTCCFFGHRTINVTTKLKSRLGEIIERRIVENQVDTFLFGSKSQFNDLCYEQVTKLKEKYPHIKRVYIRAEFPHINEDYKSYLLEGYEDTYYPEKAIHAGRAVYLERNYAMIDKSCFCIVYYKEDYSPANRKSGTKLSLNYAIKKKKEIIILPK